MAYSMIELAYDFDSLEPSIDAQTMELHYTKHYKGYLDKLNKALEQLDYPEQPIEELMMELDEVNKSQYTSIRQNGGGYYNHSIFWEMMTPGGGDLSDSFANILKEAFGSVEEFKKDFAEVAKGRFGSGWAWLILDEDGSLAITDTPNQDNPLMPHAEKVGYPILGIDVWEHAYYLAYQNKRADYIDAWRDVVDREAIERRYEQALDLMKD